MVNCSRCGQPADETRQAACPNCGAPLQTLQAPAPPTLSGGGIPGITPPRVPNAPLPPPGNNPNVRVSLTGEVIEETASPNTPAPNYVGGGNAPQMSRAGSGIAAQKKIDEQRAKQASMFRGFVIVSIVLFLMGGTYWYLKLRTNPDDQMKQYIKAVKTGELGTIYNLSSLSDDLKKDYPDSKAFEEKIREATARIPGGADGLTQYLSVIGENTKADKAEISGSEATVPVTLRLGPKPIKSDYKMRNEWGVWKVVDEGTGVVGTLAKISKGGQ